MAFENLKTTGITYLLTKLKEHFLQIKDAVKSVNGTEPGDDGDIQIHSVPFAENLESESSQRVDGAFVCRSTGGNASVTTGSAWLMDVKGNNIHEGYVPESITMTVTPVERADPITATIDRDTFVEAVSVSGTTTLVYTTEWSADPEVYGITVTGTPVSGDVITVVYVKEVRGQITVANPQSLIATGWNLYNNDTGYARVVKYSDDYGFMISGAYTFLKFSSTLSGTKTDISVVNGNFSVPSDGYVWVTGGNSTNTAIWMTWGDWTDGYPGSFAAYNVSEVSLSSLMSTYFPYGLMKAGSTVDEINLNLGQVIQRVDRMAYSEANRASAEASGREYEFDEDYIYLAKAAAVTTSVTVEGAYDADDHGIEYFTQTDVEVTAQTIYGANLKNKLERDVLTISAQSLTSAQQSQVKSNIGVTNMSGASESAAGTGGMVPAPAAGDNEAFLRGDATWAKPMGRGMSIVSRTATYTINASTTKDINENALSGTVPTGYRAVSLISVNTDDANVVIDKWRLNQTGGNWLIRLRNLSGSQISNKTLTLVILYMEPDPT